MLITYINTILLTPLKSYVDLKLSYSKKEKLKSREEIKSLFKNGSVITKYPLRLIYLKILKKDHSSCELKYGVSVSKKRFKSAVSRNYIKRLLREACRTHKYDYLEHVTEGDYCFMMIYIGDFKPNIKLVEEKMSILFKTFEKQTIKKLD